MSWQQATFKGQKVWVRLGPTGQPAEESGRVPIRYQARPGAKVYRAAAGRVELSAGAPVEALDDGVLADPSPKEAEANKGGGVARRAGAPAGTPGGFGKAGSRSAAQAAMAVEAARALVERLEGQAIVGFTDGACKGNPGPAGSGAVVWLPGGPRGEACRALGSATNNVAELVGIELALELLDGKAVPLDAEGALLTDSAYAHGVLVRGWKAKANQALVERVRAALARRPRLKLHWIAGHVGIEGNERADALANRGVLGVSEASWSP